VKPEDLLRRIEQGHHANVKFADFEALVVAFGFSLRRFGGSHRSYVRDGLPDILDLQPRTGDAKPYQVKDFLSVVRRYGLRLKDQESR
jgi:hypothetical protein